MQDIKKIRSAVTANRGGLEVASDSQIMTIWNSLDSVTRAEYLRSNSDVTNSTKRDKQGSIKRP
jgi:hypothetical protein